jgi:TonB family protein
MRKARETFSILARQSSKLVSAVFISLQPTTSAFRRYRALGVSVAAHLTLLAIIVFHNPKAINMSPDWLAFGDGPHTYQLIYFPPDASDNAPPDAAKLLFPPHLTKPRPVPHPKSQPQKPAPEPRVLADAEAGDRNSHAGSPLGTVIDGPITGHEVHVAYPTVYPDFPLDRDAFPRDLVGDVVIEVTIDSQGNVVETKIVQAIGHGIDEKIEATLRRWHYQPATLDGTPVASRHDFHYHFPS